MEVNHSQSKKNMRQNFVEMNISNNLELISERIVLESCQTRAYSSVESTAKWSTSVGVRIFVHQSSVLKRQPLYFDADSMRG